MLHHTRRWNRDHTEELHSAWLNGVGVLVWESVFGAWVGEHDAYDFFHWKIIRLELNLPGLRY